MRTGISFLHWFFCATAAPTNAAILSESLGAVPVGCGAFREPFSCVIYYSLPLGFCIWTREMSFLARNVGQPAPKWWDLHPGEGLLSPAVVAFRTSIGILGVSSATCHLSQEWRGLDSSVMNCTGFGFGAPCERHSCPSQAV